MSEQQARSFTFRIPADVDDVFREQVGERERSRFLVQALRRALGMSEETQSVAFNADLAVQTTELAYKLEVFRTEQDNVLQRLTNLEELMDQVVEKFLKPRLEQDKVLQRLIEAESVDIEAINHEVELVLQEQETCKTELSVPENLVSDLPNDDEDESKTKGKTEYKTELSVPENAIPEALNTVALQSKTESKTEFSEPLMLQLGGLEETPKEANKLHSAELLQILQKEEPRGKWTPQKLQKIQKELEGKNTWKIAGKCKFTRTGEPLQSKRIGYTWWVVYPYEVR